MLNLSTKVTTVVLPFSVKGKLVIKSIVTLSHGLDGGVNGYNSPAGVYVETLVA